MKTNKLRVLIVEDNDDDFNLLMRELKKSYYTIEYEHVIDRAGFETALSQPWDIIISDYMMPGFTGHDALQICHEKNVEAPFIMVSGAVGEDIAVDMMHFGARDYIMKNSLKRLIPAIKREFEDAVDRKKRKNAESLYHDIFHNAHDGILIIDKEGKIKDFNEAIAKMHGYSKEEFQALEINKSQFNKGGIFEELSELTHPDLSNDISRIDIEHRHKDGHVLPLSVTLNKIIAEEEVYLLLYQDITDRKKVEAAIKKKMYDLETFNRMAVGRELKMVELKKEINELLVRLGEEKRYDV